MKLSIITLNFKKSHLTIACLASLWEQFSDKLKKGEMEVIIVDNASGDDSVEEIAKAIAEHEYKNMYVFSNPKNSGFGGGCNYGAKEAQGEYFCFLNNDTAVHDTNLWKMMIYLQEHASIAILGGKLKNNNGSLQSSSGKFYTPFRILLLLLGLQRLGIFDRSPTTVAQVDWVKGALLMVRRKVFAKLKGFDENIFMYTEDMEFCYRAHLLGYKTYFYPDINIVHKDQGSSNRTFAIVHIYKNIVYFYQKHRSAGEYRLVKALLLMKAHIALFFGKITNNSYLTSTYAQALTTL